MPYDSRRAGPAARTAGPAFVLERSSRPGLVGRRNRARAKGRLPPRRRARPPAGGVQHRLLADPPGPPRPARPRRSLADPRDLLSELAPARLRADSSAVEGRGSARRRRRRGRRGAARPEGAARGRLAGAVWARARGAPGARVRPAAGPGPRRRGREGARAGEALAGGAGGRSALARGLGAGAGRGRPGLAASDRRAPARERDLSTALARDSDRESELGPRASESPPDPGSIPGCRSPPERGDGASGRPSRLVVRAGRRSRG